jgi:signal transduction histidine kinase
VQPFVDQPFTSIGQDSTWKNSTHAGTEYAALLVEPGFQPPATADALPPIGGGVVAVAVTKGAPPFWATWWFRLASLLVGLGAILALYHIHVRRLARQLNLRFEERLAERTRIARDLHDTLLQGFISASMQLHVVADRLPSDSPGRAPLDGVLRLMGQVIEEGRSAVQGLRSGARSDDLEQAFSGIEKELAVQGQAGFRVMVEGRPRPLHPLIRDEVYRIGREAVVNAFRHSGAKRIEVELEYASSRLRVLVRDDGRGIDPEVLRSGREGHWGLSGMRERAERIGARLKVWSRDEAGTEVEMSIPGHIAFRLERGGGDV